MVTSSPKATRLETQEEPMLQAESEVRKKLLSQLKAT